MRHYEDKSAIMGIASLIAAVAFLLVLSTPVAAQQPRAPSRAELKAREGSRVEQDLELRGAVKEKKVGEPDNPNNLRQVMAQTLQDFDRIQVIDRNFMITLMAKKEFDYKSLTDMMAEIRKRARRLKDNMKLPPPPPAAKETDHRKWDEISEAEMKDALLALDDRIGSFVTNRLFQTSNWIDVQLGGKASRDLEIIIEMSGDIRKSAERLSKTPR